MRKGLISLVVALVAILFTACGGGGSSSQNSVDLQGDKLGYQLTAVFSDNVSIQRADVVSRGVDYYTGELVATELNTGEKTTFDWSAYINDENFEVNSYRTVVLKEGDYSFFLNLSNSDNSKKYIAEPDPMHIADGNQTALSFSLKPVLGDLIVDINVSNEIPRLQLEYKDVSDITDENLTLLADIDGESYTLTINPDTGLSDMYLTLPNGEHNLTLELIDDDGIVLAKKELIDANLSEGSSVYEDLNIDLEPLYGEAMLDLNVTTSSLSLIINIPSAVIDEVGGVENLSTLLTYTENNNTSEKEITDINTSGSDYVASVDLENIEKGSFSFSLDFKDSSDGNALIGVCSVESFNLLESNVTKSCDLILIKRALSKSGDLLVNVGVNVFDENNLPVVGAEVYLNDEKVGETGSGFGTEGYLNFTHKKGEYTLKAVKDNKEGTLDVNLTALGVQNFELMLNRNITSSTHGQPWKYDTLSSNRELDLSNITLKTDSFENGSTTYSQAIRINDDIFLYGVSTNNPATYGNIYKSNIENPFSWDKIDEDLLLDELHYVNETLIINENIYTFGGDDGRSTFEKTILKASLDKPTNFEKITDNEGELIGMHSEIAVIGEYIYMFGGNPSHTEYSNKIKRAHIDRPYEWEDTGERLPVGIGYSQLAVINNTVYLFGGILGSKGYSNKILYASVDKLSQWYGNNENDNKLPISLAYSELAIIGEKVYLFGGYNNKDKYTDEIYYADLSAPTLWKKTNVSTGSFHGFGELIVLDDGVYLLGGRASNGDNLNSITRIGFK